MAHRGLSVPATIQPRLEHTALFTMTDSLKFSQGYIEILSSISALRWIVGALLYRPVFGNLTLKQLLNVSIGFGVFTTAAFLFLSSEISAAVVYFGSGFAGMLAMSRHLRLPQIIVLSASKVHLCRAHVGKQSRFDACQQCWLAALRRHLLLPLSSACRDLGRGNCGRFLSGAVSETRRQNAGSPDRTCFGDEKLDAFLGSAQDDIGGSPWIKRERSAGVISPHAAAAPATVSGRIFRQMSTGISGPGKATKG